MSNKNLRTAVAVALATLLGSSASACRDPEVAGRSDASVLPDAVEEVLSGERLAPEIRFASLDGEDVGLADLHGTVGVINFWGVWCLPCRTELPELVELAQKYADQPVTMVGIAIESGEPDEIREFLVDYGVEYDIWLAGMDVAVASFGAVGFPFTILVDAEGWIRQELLGPQTADSLSEEIDALLP